MMPSHLVMELVCGILETVIEIVSRGTLIGLNGEGSLQSLGLNLRKTG